MLLFFYRWLTSFAGPLIALYLRFRQWRGKEDAARLRERLGYAALPRPTGPLVWMHAASIGEAVSVLPLLRLILEQYKKLSIIVTTGTVTSSGLLASRLPPRAMHQFVPVDAPRPVRRFLHHWKPDLALFVESELWPNMITEAARTHCTLLLINARMSATSLQTWKRLPSLARRILSCFALALAQSEKDKSRLEMLGARNVHYLGNLKFDAPALPAEPKEIGALVHDVAERPLWLAASTHEGEEAMVAEVHSLLKDSHKNLLTMIVPRHPERGSTIAEICRRKGLTVAQRSHGKRIQDSTEMYIADTIGELGLFYRLSRIAFMGGSLVPHGGQNPLEAARLECAILSGPHTANFDDVYDAMIQTNAALRVHSAIELSASVYRLLADSAYQRQLSTHALHFVESRAGTTKAFLKAIEPHLQALANAQSA